MKKMSRMGTGKEFRDKGSRQLVAKRTQNSMNTLTVRSFHDFGSIMGSQQFFSISHTLDTLIVI
jgi:hypothetical protein